MGLPVVHDGDRVVIDFFAVEFRFQDAPPHTIRIEHLDLIGAVADLPVDRVALPGRRHAGIDREGLSTAAHADDALEAGAIEPSGRSGVPAPAAAAGVRWSGVDVTVE